MSYIQFPKDVLKIIASKLESEKIKELENELESQLASRRRIHKIIATMQMHGETLCNTRLCQYPGCTAISLNGSRIDCNSIGWCVNGHELCDKHGPLIDDDIDCPLCPQ